MGQKINPIALRLGILYGWESKWYMKIGYADYLHEDLKIRNFIKKELKNAEIGKIETVRYPERLTINIFTARPGLVIGRKGNDIEALKKKIQKITKKKLHLNIIELRDSLINAELVSSQIAKQLENRVPYKRAIKQAVQNSMRAGAKGVKIILSGRLGGAEMARQESYKEGRVPLHTLRANLDYAFSGSMTQYGVIGVKVWFFKGEELNKKLNLG